MAFQIWLLPYQFDRHPCHVQQAEEQLECQRKEH
ncbi:hypothetical protein Leryth_005819 [Lithospermum erythrorhizon]|nr:hypothetical protein Leryth_005819 [Lithospermum erythrorhizon]